MKTLFIGGVKSGKSRLAEDYILLRAKDKPTYLATTEFFDDEMEHRVKEHQQRRQDRFTTVEEPVYLNNALIKCSNSVLIECVSMWLNNLMHRKTPEQKMLQELEDVLCSSKELVFVLNEVGMGIIPDNPLARQFVDISGKASQLLGSRCDEVYFCCAGIAVKIK